MGNQGQDVNALNYPAGYRRVLGVGAQCDGIVTFDCPRPFQAATFSNHNRTVDVIAPGVNVLSSVPKRVTEREVAPGYALKDGTSMAAPYVSGVAALVMAANGNALSPYQVLRQIENTANDLGPAGRDNVNGYGVVNPRAAVTLPGPADDVDEVNDDVKWLKGSIRLTEAKPLVVTATRRPVRGQRRRLRRPARARRAPARRHHARRPASRPLPLGPGHAHRRHRERQPRAPPHRLPAGHQPAGRHRVPRHARRRLLRQRLRPARRRRLHPTAHARLMAPVRHVVLTYEYVADILERRAPHREAHLARIAEWVGSGTMLMAGAVGDPPAGALFVFGDVPAEEVERYAEGDPYVLEGLVTSRRIAPWTVVASRLEG